MSSSRTLRPALRLSALALVAAPLLAQAPAAPRVAPGGALRFPRAGGIVVADAPPAAIEREFFPAAGLGASFALTNGDALFDTGEKLRAAAIATQALGRGKVVVARHTDFEVVADGGRGAVVQARVSASAAVRGFLLLMGAGKAKVKVELKVIDVTEPGDPSVLHSEELVMEEITGSFKPQVGVDVGALLPVPDGQAAVSLEFQTEGEKKLVDETCDVALDLLLQRGRRYRVQLELTALARTGVMGGVAHVGFWFGNGSEYEALGLDPRPSLLDPAHWREPLRSIEPLLSLSRIDESAMRGFLQNTSSRFLGDAGPLPQIVGALQAKDEINVRSTVVGGDESIASVFSRVGFPVKLAVQSLLDWLPKPSLPAEEEVAGLGAWMTDLSVALGSDDAESADRELEARLESGAPTVGLLLPAAHGGQLEQALALVDGRIDAAAQCGLPGTSGARTYHDAALAAYAQKSYRLAFDRLAQAYRLLLGKKG